MKTRGIFPPRGPSLDEGRRIAHGDMVSLLHWKDKSAASAMAVNPLALEKLGR